MRTAETADSVMAETARPEAPDVVELSRFECRCCGACCRIPDGICRVGEAEIRRIAEHLGIGEEEFIANETELAPDRKTLMLKNTEEGACAWLAADNRCRIHPVKPDKCRTFPFEWRNCDSHEICPGIASLRKPAERR